MIKCHSYCVHQKHDFLYKLSPNQIRAIQLSGKQNLFGKKESIELEEDASSQSQFKLIKQQMNEFLKKNPNKLYFLKLSSISPKDIKYCLDITNVENDDLEGSESSSLDENVETIEEIKESIDCLCVGKSLDRMADYCINVLTKSERVYYEICFSDQLDFSIVLMPWKKIPLETETRCYIQDWKLIGISQYYVDILNYGFSENRIPIIKQKIIDYVINFLEHNKKDFVFKDCTLDIFLDNTNVVIVEANNYDDSDKCLFMDNETLEKSFQQSNGNPVFKLKQNGLIRNL